MPQINLSMVIVRSPGSRDLGVIGTNIFATIIDSEFL